MIERQSAYLRLEHCDIATMETSETSTLCVETRQMSVLATEDICLVSAADISLVARTDICLLSTHNVDVSDVSIVAMSQRSSLR